MDAEMEPFYVAAPDDTSVSAGDDRSTRSDDASITSDRSSSTTHLRQPDRRPHRHRRMDGQMSAASISYHGINIIQAAGQGNLPLCVLLWGMATAKRVNLMDPDPQGNTPMHFAALADLPEVPTANLKNVKQFFSRSPLLSVLIRRSWGFSSNKGGLGATMTIAWWTPGMKWAKLPCCELLALGRFQS